jgi:hypothetical protein
MTIFVLKTLIIKTSMKTQFFLLIIIIMSISCGNKDRGVVTNVEILVLDKRSNNPRTETEARIFKVKKPLFFGSWEFHEQERIYTDSIGKINFRASNGEYSIRFYKNEKFLYSADELEIEGLNEKKVIVKW